MSSVVLPQWQPGSSVEAWCNSRAAERQVHYGKIAASEPRRNWPQGLAVQPFRRLSAVREPLAYTSPQNLQSCKDRLLGSHCHGLVFSLLKLQQCKLLHFYIAMPQLPGASIFGKKPSQT